MVDVVGQLYALLPIHILEHIDGLIAASTIVGLLIWGELGGVLYLLDNLKIAVGLTCTIATVSFVSKLLKLWGQ